MTGFPVLFLILWPFFNEVIADQRYPEYSYRDHPLYLFNISQHSSLKPVVMRKYHFLRMGQKNVYNSMFVPQAGSYLKYPCHTSFASSLDVLFLPHVSLDSSNRETFLHIQMNYRARVFLLMTGPGLHGRRLYGTPNITGIPSAAWGRPISVITTDESSKNERPKYGEKERWGASLFQLPYYGVIIEVPFPLSLELTLPHPRTFSINNVTIDRYILLFAQALSSSIMPIPLPTLPDNFTALASDMHGIKSPVSPHLNPPIPNRTCPRWLHDLYVTDSRADHDWEMTGEPHYWRTWHPMIDPIYWCYYDHEHGAYPGNYRPMFGYTPWKTADPNSPTGRQLESHAGFKLFSFQVPDTNRIVICTIHMHLSKARRFNARRHTVIFAVVSMLNASRWEIEMELHMKMDFGPAEISFANRSTLPLNSAEWNTEHQLTSKRIKAGRRFNVLDLSNFPSSVDDSFQLSGGIAAGPRVLSHGIYEQWKGPLNTCSGSSGMTNRGFTFDVRDPATAIRTLKLPTDDKNMQQLSGKSMNRVVSIGGDGVQVGLRYCILDIFASDATINLNAQNGVFYTNVHFSSVHHGPGRNLVRQYIKPDFKDLYITPGHYTPVDPWYTKMELERTGNIKRRFLDIERAVQASEN